MITLVIAFGSGLLLGLLVGAVLAASGDADAAREGHTVAGDSHCQKPP